MRAYLTAAIFLAASTANAGFYTGNDLHGFCLQNRDIIYGYVGGFIDKQSTDAILMKRLIQESENKTLPILQGLAIGDICYPKNIQLQQPKDLFCRYLAEHPERRQANGEDLLRDALLEVWACK